MFYFHKHTHTEQNQGNKIREIQGGCAAFYFHKHTHREYPQFENYQELRRCASLLSVSKKIKFINMTNRKYPHEFLSHGFINTGKCNIANPLCEKSMAGLPDWRILHDC